MTDAEKLINFRRYKGWTQAELARRLRLEQQVISRVESNNMKKCPPSVKYSLLKYCDYDIETDITNFRGDYLAKNDLPIVRVTNISEGKATVEVSFV